MRLIFAVSGIRLGEDVSIIRLKHLLGIVCLHLVGANVSYASCRHKLSQITFGCTSRNACAQRLIDTLTSDTVRKPQELGTL